jgi:hypothetical protein
MTKYIVFTPSYTTGGYGFAPLEYGADVVEVEADSKRAALIKGLRELTRIGSQWVMDMRSDNRNPFNGLKAHADWDCQGCGDCQDAMG